MIGAGDVEWLAILLRLVTATFIGGAVGVNREWRHKPAGVRTHALVSLGAATVMIVAAAIDGSDRNASSRALQGIITGIGFLGGGVIIHHTSDASVSGLTTAATIWIAAGLGLACGGGNWPVATMAALLAVVVLTLGGIVEGFVHRLARWWDTRAEVEPGGLPDVSELADGTQDRESSR